MSQAADASVGRQNQHRISGSEVEGEDDRAAHTRRDSLDGSSMDWESPSTGRRAARASLILLAFVVTLGLASWLASSRPTILAVPMTMSRWESYASSGVAPPTTPQSAKQGQMERATSAWRAYEQTKGQAAALRREQILSMKQMKVDQRAQRERSVRRLEASLMHRTRGRKGRTSVHQTLLPGSVGQKKLAQLLMGKVEKDEKAIATLSTAVYRLRTMDRDIAHDERGGNR